MGVMFLTLRTMRYPFENAIPQDRRYAALTCFDSDQFWGNYSEYNLTE